MEISFTKIGCLLGQPHVDCRSQFLVVSANRKGLISTTVWAANNLYQIDAVMMAICINFEHKLLYIPIQVGLQYILINVQNYLSVWMYINIHPYTQLLNILRLQAFEKALNIFRQAASPSVFHGRVTRVCGTNYRYFC